MLDTAIVLAGGQGTRLRPLTDDLPKPMIPMHDKPLLEHIVADLEGWGVQRICIAAGYKAERITEHFDASERRRSGKLMYIIEKEPLGTGGAVKAAFELLGKPEDVLVVHGDTIFTANLEGMYELHRNNRALITLGTTTVEDVRTFGMIETDGALIKRIVEKPRFDGPQPGTISAGVYIISKAAVDEMPGSKVFSLEHDVLERWAGRERLCCYPLDSFHTVNTPEQYRALLKLLEGR